MLQLKRQLRSPGNAFQITLLGTTTRTLVIGEGKGEENIVKHNCVKFIIKHVMKTKGEHGRLASTLYSTIEWVRTFINPYRNWLYTKYG